MRDHFVDQAYIDHFRREHSRIHQAVRDVEHELHLAATSRDDERVATRLTQLRQTLARHFNDEDEGGCIEEAISRCPSLSREAVLVEKEHPMLLQLIDRLIERARSGFVGCATDDFVESFRRFAKTLHAHEAAENSILERAFGTAAYEEAG